MDDADDIPSVAEHTSYNALRMLRSMGPPSLSGRGSVENGVELGGGARSRDYQTMHTSTTTHQPLPSIAENRPKRGMFSQIVNIFSSRTNGDENQPSMGIAYSADEKTR